MPITYEQILKSYEENPKIQILHKIRGKRAVKTAAVVMDADADWLARWTEDEKKGAKAFFYVRRLRTKVQYGFKLVIQHGEKQSVLGQEFAEKDIERFLSFM